MTKYQDLFHQNMIFILQYRYLQNDTQGASSCLRGHRRMLISEVTAMLSNCPPFCDFRPLLYCSTAATPLRNYAVVSRWIRNIDANPYWFHLELLSSWIFFSSWTQNHFYSCVILLLQCCFKLWHYYYSIKRSFETSVSLFCEIADSLKCFSLQW